MKKRGFLRWISDLIWPMRCIGCHAQNIMLCNQCTDHIKKRSSQDCIVCHRPNRDGAPCFSHRSSTAVSRLFAAGDLKQPLLEQAIWHLKYRNMPDLAPPLAHFMVRTLPPDIFAHNPLLVPVPMHPKRRAERGYNQAELLATCVADATAMPLASDVLIRVRMTDSQVETHSRHERIENMRDAFRCVRPESVEGRAVVLIDDVCTTGATLNACAQAISEAGANQISAIVVARK